MWSKQYNSLFHDSKSWKKVTVFPNVIVTPELASELLKMNQDNRPVKSAILGMYASDMLKEKWHFCGDTIKISSSGRLLDGQHRLMAITQTGMPQTFNIQTGLEESSFQVMDIGKNRSGGDILAIMGHKNYHVMNTAIKLVLRYDDIKSKKVDTLDERKRISNEEIADWCRTHDMDLMDKCCTEAGGFYTKARILAPGTYAGLYYILSRKDRDDAMLFFEMLSTGSGITESVNSPIYVCRQKLINMLNSRLNFKQASLKYALIIRAWNFWRNKQEIKQLNINADDATKKFPEAI